MTQSFRRTATAEFLVAGTDVKITVSNVPYIWIPATGVGMDEEGIYACRDWFRKNMNSPTCHLITISVCTSPIKEGDAA